MTFFTLQELQALCAAHCASCSKQQRKFTVLYLAREMHLHGARRLAMVCLVFANVPSVRATTNGLLRSSSIWREGWNEHAGGRVCGISGLPPRRTSPPPSTPPPTPRNSADAWTAQLACPGDSPGCTCSDSSTGSVDHFAAGDQRLEWPEMRRGAVTSWAMHPMSALAFLVAPLALSSGKLRTARRPLLLLLVWGLWLPLASSQLAPSSPSVGTANIWRLAGNGCTGANEHGQFSDRTLSACAAQCLALTTCISFEFQAASGTTNNCQLSSSCNTQHADYNPIQTDWWLFIRGTSTFEAPNYSRISTGGCAGANELGAYAVNDTLATCAARCDALQEPSTPGALCTNTCNYDSDAMCDDGGQGAEYTSCSRGTDCADCGPRQPEACTDTCTSASDAVCDDGGPGAEYTRCSRGTDCADCDPRPPVDSIGQPCTETCNYASDAECDDGGPGAEYTWCSGGTDCADCGPRQPNLCTNTCTSASDAECDDGGPGAEYTRCSRGTDCADCGPRPACTSFQFRPSDGMCQLSSTCASGYELGGTYDLYIWQPPSSSSGAGIGTSLWQPPPRPPPASTTDVCEVCSDRPSDEMAACNPTQWCSAVTTACSAAGFLGTNWQSQRCKSSSWASQSPPVCEYSCSVAGYGYTGIPCCPNAVQPWPGTATAAQIDASASATICGKIDQMNMAWVTGTGDVKTFTGKNTWETCCNMCRSYGSDSDGGLTRCCGWAFTLGWPASNQPSANECKLYIRASTTSDCRLIASTLQQPARQMSGRLSNIPSQSPPSMPTPPPPSSPPPSPPPPSPPLALMACNDGQVRFDCHPEPDTGQIEATCRARGCCWVPAPTGSAPGTPLCFHLRAPPMPPPPPAPPCVVAGTHTFTGNANSYLTAIPRTGIVGRGLGFTLCAWVNRTQTGSSWERLIDFGSGTPEDNILVAFAG